MFHLPTVEVGIKDIHQMLIDSVQRNTGWQFTISHPVQPPSQTRPAAECNNTGCTKVLRLCLPVYWHKIAFLPQASSLSIPTPSSEKTDAPPRHAAGFWDVCPAVGGPPAVAAAPPPPPPSEPSSSWKERSSPSSSSSSGLRPLAAAAGASSESLSKEKREPSEAWYDASWAKTKKSKHILLNVFSCF